MYYYLTRYLGVGTRRNPFRAVGTVHPDCQTIDLRSGGGLGCQRETAETCLLASPIRIGDARVRLIGEGHDIGPRVAQLAPDFDPGRRRVLVTGTLALLAWMNRPQIVWAGATASDNFNRTENPLASGWVAQSGFAVNKLKATGSSAQGITASVDNVSIYTATAFIGDQFSEAVLVASIGSGGPWVRGSASVAQGYVLSVSTNLFDIYKYTGVFTQMGGDFGLGSNGVGGHTYRITATGTATTTLEAKDNGVVLTTRTDVTSPPSGGAPGLDATGTSIAWDSWAAGDVLILKLKSSSGNLLTVGGDLQTN